MSATHPFDYINKLAALPSAELHLVYNDGHVAEVRMAQAWLFDVPPDDVTNVESFERAVRRCREEYVKWSRLLGDAIIENTEQALKDFAAGCTAPFYRHIAQTQLGRHL